MIVPNENVIVGNKSQSFLPHFSNLSQLVIVASELIPSSDTISSITSFINNLHSVGSLSECGGVLKLLPRFVWIAVSLVIDEISFVVHEVVVKCLILMFPKFYNECIYI